MQPGDYVVRPTCIRDEKALINFLNSNDFKYEKHFENNPLDNEYVTVINVIHRIYFNVDRYFLSGGKLTEIEFLNQINYYPEGDIIHRKLFSDDEGILYEGYTVNNKPYGLGTVYFANGNKFREGIFDIKGLAEGKEYYPNGNVRFEGLWQINTAYGPNYPVLGSLYNEKGQLMFSGKFEVKRGGVGYPMMKYPKFGIQKSPEIKYVDTADLGMANVKSRSRRINSMLGD